MKGFLFVICLLLIAPAWRSSLQIIDRFDTTPEYSSNSPFPLGTLNRATGERVDHVGPYQAKEIFTYEVKRNATRTVTAAVTRRIVQIVPVVGGFVRMPVYSYPNQGGTRIEANDGKESVSYLSLPLPDASILPRGNGYRLETSIEFPSRGERDARTYTGETIPFSVE